MRIEITGAGIYTSDGKEIPVGTELTVKSEPLGWAGRYRVVGKTEGKEPVLNEGPKTVAEALALFSTEGVNVNAAKAGAKKFLGDKVKADANKEAILAALLADASDTEIKTFLGAKGVEVKDETRDDLIKLAQAA